MSASRFHSLAKQATGGSIAYSSLFCKRVKDEHSRVRIVLVSYTTHLCRDASTCIRIPTDSRDGESHAILMTRERVSMKEIFGGLDHLLEKSYLSLLFFSRFFGESIELLSTVFAEEPQF